MNNYKYDMDEKNQNGWQVVHAITQLFVRNYMEKLFEGFIRNERTDIYNSMCSIDENKK